MRVLKELNEYQAVRDAYQWDIPARVNMAYQVCDRHAETIPDKIGLIVAHPDGTQRDYNWAELAGLSNKMANFLKSHGINRGERIGILLSQCVEAAISHVAAWKMGAVSIPLFSLFGEEALSFRLNDSGAKVIVTESIHLTKIEASILVK